MATMGYRLNSEAKNNWALQGESIFYGSDEIIQLDKQKYPALIDTGSQNIVVPSKQFAFLKKKWLQALTDLDCETDEYFCEVQRSCSSIKA